MHNTIRRFQQIEGESSRNLLEASTAQCLEYLYLECQYRGGEAEGEQPDDQVDGPHLLVSQLKDGTVEML